MLLRFACTCLVFTAFLRIEAQSLRYRAGDDWLVLQPDSHSLVLHFDSELPFRLLLRENLPGLLSVAPLKCDVSDRVILTFDTSSALSPQAWAEEVLTDTSLLRSASYGLRLPDGLFAGLTHRVVCKPLNSSYLSQIEALALGYQAAGPFFTQTQVLFFELPDIQQVIPFSEALALSGLCAWAHPDFMVEAVPAADPLFPFQFALENTGQWIDGQYATPDIDIDAPEAWLVTLGDSSVHVGIFDEGVEAHEDLEDAAGNSRVLTGFSIYPGGSGVPLIPQDGHGQAIAGLIAASHNSLGIKGVAPGVKLLPVYMPFDLTITLSQFADGINLGWQNGADVMCNAWAIYTCLNNPFPVITQAITDGHSLGRGGLGTVMLFAAGNNASCVGFPASLPQVLAMGAVDMNGLPAPYANQGPQLDLVAPSSGAVANVYTLDRMGANGFNVSGAAGDLANISYTRYFGGTSTATALGSGASALLLSLFPYLTELEIRTLLTTSATDLAAPGFDDATGFGLLNIYDAIQAALAAYPLGPQEELPQAAAGEKRQGIYPNPAGEWLYLLSDTEIRSISLWDSKGRQAPLAGWTRETSGRIAVPLRGMAAGLYQIRAFSPEGKVFTARFLMK